MHNQKRNLEHEELDNEKRKIDLNQAISNVMKNLYPGKKVCRSRIVTSTISEGIIYSCDCKKNIEGKTICNISVFELEENKNYNMLLAFDKNNNIVFVDDKSKDLFSEEEMKKRVLNILHPVANEKVTSSNAEYLGL